MTLIRDETSALNPIPPGGGGVGGQKVPALTLSVQYLLLTEFEGRTVNYDPSFSPSIYGRAGHKSKGKTRCRNLQYGPRKRG